MVASAAAAFAAPDRAAWAKMQQHTQRKIQIQIKDKQIAKIQTKLYLLHMTGRPGPRCSTGARLFLAMLSSLYIFSVEISSVFIIVSFCSFVARKSIGKCHSFNYY